MAEHAELIHLFRRQSLKATVARACKNCGAPGFWHDVPGVNPGCYDPDKKAAALANHQGFAPVGPVCPQCGSQRDEVEDLGEIWSKVWRAPNIWEQVREKIRTMWRLK